jgi:hypothetical protein
MSVNVRLLVLATLSFCGACREAGRGGRGAGGQPEATADADDGEGIADSPPTDMNSIVDAFPLGDGDLESAVEVLVEHTTAADAGADEAGTVDEPVVIVDHHAVPEAVRSRSSESSRVLPSIVGKYGEVMSNLGGGGLTAIGSARMRGTGMGPATLGSRSGSRETRAMVSAGSST